MRLLIVCFILLIVSHEAFAKSAAEIVTAAQERTTHNVMYQSSYVNLAYPGGDVPRHTGVCTDVIIRTYRNALGFDFQKAVHEDMKANFSAYPQIWGHSGADKNIDHRRVPNLETYLKRQGASVPISQSAQDYQPGDIVSWRLFNGGTPHIGIVTNKTSPAGTPLIVHNIGAGPREDDILFEYDIEGHFRFLPDRNLPEMP
ncbi:MAG: DUF1287 domain-containing protein [Hellea sp.]|nr:DUF1287 domain-containing protein [Hellea sp.]